MPAGEVKREFKKGVIGMFYRRALRPLLFAMDAETAHERTLGMLSAGSRLPLLSSREVFTRERLQTCVAGMNFPNPIGLAAGCDKNGSAVPIWPRFGFGFVEVGTVTAQPQPGNPRPRVFRIPEREALINRLGFNSEGATVVAHRLSLLRRGRPLPVPLAINIGKTKLVSGDEATLDDYRSSYRKLAPLADFIVVNVSSPNTPGLREWQEKSRLQSLLSMLMGEGKSISGNIARTDQASVSDFAVASEHPLAADSSSGMTGSGDKMTAEMSTLKRCAPPLFLKISPDMAQADLDDVLEAALSTGIAGVIATNTTLARPSDGCRVEETGGMSGRPLRSRANEVLRYLYSQTHGRLPLIGVGGIGTPEDVYERIRSGASLVQIYTALIYEGPSLPRLLNEGLLRLMDRDGIKSVGELVGAGE